MFGTSDDMHCELHETLNESCGKKIVYQFQFHKHGFSCNMKGKKIRILAGEGHGRQDNKQISEENFLSQLILMDFHTFNDDGEKAKRENWVNFIVEEMKKNLKCSEF